MTEIVNSENGMMKKSPQLLGDGILHTRNLILRGMCAIYLMAFIAFHHQSPGKRTRTHKNLGFNQL